MEYKNKKFKGETVLLDGNSFIGLAAAILAERALWSLDAPLSRNLPGLTLRAPLSADSISIRSLRSHTHGIANSGPLTTRLAYTSDLRGAALAPPTGLGAVIYDL